MGGRKRRRKLDRDLVEHMVNQQIDPQLRAERLRQEGLNVEVAMVNTDPDAGGMEVECVRCHRKAHMPFTSLEFMAVMCPTCVRALNMGEAR